MKMGVPGLWAAEAAAVRSLTYITETEQSCPRLRVPFFCEFQPRLKNLHRVGLKSEMCKSSRLIELIVEIEPIICLPGSGNENLDQEIVIRKLLTVLVRELGPTTTYSYAQAWWLTVSISGCCHLFGGSRPR